MSDACLAPQGTKRKQPVIDFCIPPQGLKSGGGGGPPPAFSPSDIAGLVLWLDANVGITLNGSDVSAWDDQSGKSHDFAQATASAQPAYDATGFNGKPTVTFDGISEFMDTAMTADLESTTGFTFVFVLKIPTMSTGAMSLLGNRPAGPFGSSPGFIALETASTNGYDNLTLEDDSGNYAAHATSRTWSVKDNDNPVIVTVTMEESAINVYHNNFIDARIDIDTSSGTLGNVTSTSNLTLGDRPGLSRFWEGDVSEVLMFEGVLSAADRKSVYEYEEAKWLSVLPTVSATLIADWDARWATLNVNPNSFTQVDDRSGNDNHLLVDALSNDPFFTQKNAGYNNYPTVSTDGSSEWANCAFAGGEISQPNTIFHVGRVVNLIANEFIYDGISASKRHSSSFTATDWRLDAGTEVTDASADTTAAIHCDVFNGADSKKYVAGTLTVDGDAGTDGLTGITWAARYDEDRRAHIVTTRMIVYNGLLSDAEINSVGNNLAAFYGLTWSDI